MNVSSAMDGSNTLTCNLPVEAEAFQSILRNESPDVYPRLPNIRVGSSNKGRVWRKVPCGDWEGISREENGMIRGYTTKGSGWLCTSKESLNPRMSPVEMDNG